MMKKKIAAILTAAVLCVGLAGCGESVIPDMTDEQMKAMGEYVAITMMKYDANHRSRLVDLEEIFPKLEEAGPEPTVTPEPSPEPSREPSGMGPVDQTPVIDAAGNNSRSIEEVLALPDGVSIVYSGQQICSAYPNNGGEISLFLDASKGKKLLALEFILVNSGEQEQEINVLSTDASFRITVNGDYARNALKTYLPSDLSTFNGKVPGSSRAGVAVLIEVDEAMASDISSVSLRVKNGEKVYTIQLL